jgi:hypothetical protein
MLIFFFLLRLDSLRYCLVPVHWCPEMSGTLQTVLIVTGKMPLKLLRLVRRLRTTTGLRWGQGWRKNSKLCERKGRKGMRKPTWPCLCVSVKRQTFGHVRKSLRLRGYFKKNKRRRNANNLSAKRSEHKNKDARLKNNVDENVLWRQRRRSVRKQKRPTSKSS